MTGKAVGIVEEEAVRRFAGKAIEPYPVTQKTSNENHQKGLGR